MVGGRRGRKTIRYERPPIPNALRPWAASGRKDLCVALLGWSAPLHGFELEDWKVLLAVRSRLPWVGSSCASIRILDEDGEPLLEKTRSSAT
jgi:hypothetical protein